MKRILSISLLLFTLTTDMYAQAADIPLFEIGLLLGEPLGVSAKYWYGERSAIDAAVAWSFTEEGIFEVHADYLLHPLLRTLENGTLPVYIGLGPALRIGEDWFLGGRLPIGVQYLFETFPLSIFGEIAPQWQLLPDNEFVLSGGIGIRLAFGSVR